MSVPNQKIIYVHRKKKQSDPFVALNIDTMKAVYCDLKNAYTFYLYLCLCSNKDGYKLEYSPKGIAARFGMNENTARDQFKKLVEKGYLILLNEESNIYNFYAEPPHIKEQLDEYVAAENSQENTVKPTQIATLLGSEKEIIPKPQPNPCPFIF